MIITKSCNFPRTANDNLNAQKFRQTLKLRLVFHLVLLQLLVQLVVSYTIFSRLSAAIRERVGSEATNSVSALLFAFPDCCVPLRSFGWPFRAFLCRPFSLRDAKSIPSSSPAPSAGLPREGVNILATGCYICKQYPRTVYHDSLSLLLLRDSVLQLDLV